MAKFSGCPYPVPRRHWVPVQIPDGDGYPVTIISESPSTNAGMLKLQQMTKCGARGRCRIRPPRFLAECRKRRLNQGSFVSAVCLVACILWFILGLCVFLWFMSFFLIVCLSVTFKWLAVKTASEMTYTVSGGALNSTQSNPDDRVGRFWSGNVVVTVCCWYMYTGLVRCYNTVMTSCQVKVAMISFTLMTATTTQQHIKNVRHVVITTASLLHASHCLVAGSFKRRL